MCYLKVLYRCYADYQKWDEKPTVIGEPVRKAKEKVCDAIRDATGLKLDYMNSAGGKTGTLTTGEQARRFFSNKGLPIIKELLSKPNNIKHQGSMLKLHQQLSIVLWVISCIRKINVPLFEKHWEETMLNIAYNFPWCKRNHILHGAIQHSCYLIEMNGGESLGWYSEKGLEANSKDIRKFLERLSRKNCKNKQIKDVHHRLLEQSDPYLIHMTSTYMSEKKCNICNNKDHTSRSHQKYTTEELDALIWPYFL